KAVPEERVEYNLAHILVRVPEQASPERIQAAREKAEKARDEARASSDFGRIAASFSDAQDALQGGVLGWRTQDRLPELYASALLGMKPGEVSEVLRSPAGFHVLKLIERRGSGADNAPVLQTRLRHILVRPSEQMSENDARRRLEDIRERIVHGGADFAELARVHSDDATAARGGELDWVYPGDTVPDFERAYQDLKVGELSEPIKTPFGYHLIQVLERRSADMSPERAWKARSGQRALCARDPRSRRARLPGGRVRRHGDRAGAKKRDQRRRNCIHRSHRVPRRARASRARGDDARRRRLARRACH